MLVKFSKIYKINKYNSKTKTNNNHMKKLKQHFYKIIQMNMIIKCNKLERYNLQYKYIQVLNYLTVLYNQQIHNNVNNFKDNNQNIIEKVNKLYQLHNYFVNNKISMVQLHYYFKIKHT